MKTSILISSVLLLSACAVAPQQAWFHTSGRADQRQFQVDDGVCTAIVYRTVGSPPPADGGGTSTTFSGQYSTGTTFRGQAETVPRSQGFGFSEGFQTYEAKTRYNNAVRSVFRGCMAERGWSLQNRQ